MENNSFAFGNILTDLSPEGAPKELSTDLLRAENVRIERIVSRGQCSEEGFWYDQEEDEWVMVCSGSAVMEFEGPREIMELKPADWVHIPARRKHRVNFTSDPTVWLAVWFRKNACQTYTELD